MNGESIGEIRFKATSGDILVWFVNHHWKQKERWWSEYSEELDRSFLKTATAHGRFSCMNKYFVSRLMRASSNDPPEETNPPLLTSSGQRLHHCFSGTETTLQIQFPPPFQSWPLHCPTRPKATLLYLTTGSFLLWGLKKPSLTILSPNTQNVHTIKSGTAPSVSPQEGLDW